MLLPWSHKFLAPFSLKDCLDDAISWLAPGHARLKWSLWIGLRIMLRENSIILYSLFSEARMIFVYPKEIYKECIISPQTWQTVKHFKSLLVIDLRVTAFGMMYTLCFSLSNLIPDSHNSSLGNETVSEELTGFVRVPLSSLFQAGKDY